MLFNIIEKHNDRTQSHKNKPLENLPNDNIYKNDTRYKMLKDLTFEMQIDEEAANKDISERYSYLACRTIPFCFLIFFPNFSFNNNFEIVISLLSITLMSLYIYLINQKAMQNQKSDIGILKTNLVYKIILEIILCNQILLNSKKEDLSYNYLIYYNIFSYFYSLTFQVNILHSIKFNLLKSIIFIIKLIDNNAGSNFFIRLFFDFFSSKIIILIIMTLLMGVFEYFINKVIREFWALYDSFKRSYYTMKKCLMDEHPIPSILITNKRPNFFILHKNKAAQELLEKSANSKPKDSQEPFFKKSQNFKKDFRTSSKNNSEIINLEDIFTNEMEISFCAEMEKCIFNRRKCFDFPLKNLEKTTKWVVKQSDAKQTFFEGDLNKYEWHRVIVSPCNWKNQEAIFIQFIKNDEFRANELIKTYYSSINEQMNILLDNSEMVCNKIVENEFDKSKDKSSDQRYKNSLDGDQSKASPPKNSQDNSMQNRDIKNYNSNNSFKTIAPYIKKTNNIYIGSNSKISNFFLNIDHSLMLFFKYNTNFLYDMNLTGQMYYSFINKKIFPSTERINLKNFLNYFFDYFFIVAKLNNFKLVIHNLCDSEIIVSYYYFRTIIFNILLFILNNSSSQEEKVLEINVKNERNFESKHDMYNFHFEIKYYDNKLKINYNNLRDILTVDNSHKNIEIDKEISKINCVDLGIVLTNHILNYVYDNNLIMVSYGNNHSLAFFIKGYLVTNSPMMIPSHSYPEMKFKEPRSIIFEQYHMKILDKVYKVKTPVVTKAATVNNKVVKFDCIELNKGFNYVNNLPNEASENEEKCKDY